MATYVYSGKYDPLVLPGENLGISYIGKTYYYQVDKTLAVPSFVYTVDATIDPNSSVDVDLSDYAPTDDNILIQLWVEPLDDVDFQIWSPETSPMWSIENKILSMSSPNKTHTPTVDITAASTNTTLWNVSDDRYAYMTKLMIYNSGTVAATVSILNGAGDKVLPDIPVGATSTVTFYERELPRVYFSDAIQVSSTQAGVTVSAEVIEVGPEYEPRFAQLFMMHRMVPKLVVSNPTKYSITNPRLRMFGYKYYLIPKDILAPGEPCTIVPASQRRGQWRPRTY